MRESTALGYHPPALMGSTKLSHFGGYCQGLLFTMTQEYDNKYKMIKVNNGLGSYPAAPTGTIRLLHHIEYYTKV